MITYNGKKFQTKEDYVEFRINESANRMVRTNQIKGPIVRLNMIKEKRQFRKSYIGNPVVEYSANKEKAENIAYNLRGACRNTKHELQSEQKALILLNRRLVWAFGEL